jgi:hypothetical protein
MENLQIYFCWNQECMMHGVRGQGNIRVRSQYGKNENIRLLYCLVCGKKFSERKGTVLFNSRLSEEGTLFVIGHIVEGFSARQIERETNVRRSTVGRLKKLLIKLATAPADEVLYD